MAELLGRLLRTPQGSIGLALVLIVLAVALGGPELAPHNPEALSPLRHYRPPGGEYLLGTDQPGRDILSRLLAGARATVLLALLATFIGTIAGAVIGTASAFSAGGWTRR